MIWGGTMPVASIEQIRAKLGTEIGVSPWILIDQAAINIFADVTGDHQFIHVDPEAAARTPFGGTVAHGFLTLSLLSQMAGHVMLVPETLRMAANYGFDKVRFLAPVRAGKRVRGRFKLVDMEEKRPGEWRFVHNVAVEIEGEEKPALTADWIGMIFI
jgi:acyl dehydratase